MHTDDTVRRHRQLGQQHIHHRPHAGWPAGDEQPVAVEGVHHFAEIGQDRPDRGLDDGVHLPRMGRDLDRERVEGDSPGAGGKPADIVDRGRGRAPIQQRAQAAAEDLVRAALRRVLAGMQDGEPDRLQDLGHELAAQMPLRLALRALLAAEQLLQQRLGVARASGDQRILDLRDDDGLYDVLQHLVAGDPETLAEILVGRDFLALFGDEGADHQVRRAAADVDAGHAQRGLRAILRPRLAGQGEEGRRVAAQALRDLGIEEGDLGRRRLVHIGDDARLRRRLARGAAPAQQVPGQPRRGFRAVAEDTLFGQRHRRRHGQDDAR